MVTLTILQSFEVTESYTTKHSRCYGHIWQEAQKKIRVNDSEIKQLVSLKFCLAQFVMDVNLFLEYPFVLELPIN